jgi:hypothetical protein
MPGVESIGVPSRSKEQGLSSQPPPAQTSGGLQWQ